MWHFKWDGVPKKNGSTYVGTRIDYGVNDKNVYTLMKGQLYLPSSFISNYYPVSIKKVNGIIMIFIGTVPENPTVNYFGSKGEYPATFDFNPLDPTVKYPGGWIAPQLQSSWSPNQQKNFQAFENELGFKDGGQSFGITGASKVITIFDTNPDDDIEITIRFTGWGTPPGKPNSTISESFKIPVVSAQLFNFFLKTNGNQSGTTAIKMIFLKNSH